MYSTSSLYLLISIVVVVIIIIVCMWRGGQFCSQFSFIIMRVLGIELRLFGVWQAIEPFCESYYQYTLF